MEPSSGFPLNRQFALALPDTEFDPVHPAPHPKTRFLMLQRDERLVELSTRYDENTGLLSIAHQGARMLEADLGTAAGRDEVEAFFAEFLSDRLLGRRPRLVSAPGFQFTDVSVVSEPMMHAVSLINLASLRALESAVNRELHPLRFRANIYFDGVAAWEEHGWLDHPIRIGGAVGRVVLRTTRCAATQVNPDTAERDCNVPKELQQAFGHADLGVYAEIEAGGLVRIGDEVGRG